MLFGSVMGLINLCVVRGNFLMKWVIWFVGVLIGFFIGVVFIYFFV